MIDIVLDERCIFTYNDEEKSVGIWRHRDGVYKGPVEGPLGFVTFASMKQAESFAEMLELMIEKKKKEAFGI